MGKAAVAFGGVVMVGAAALGLWLWTHPVRRRVVPGSGPGGIRFERWRARRRGVMVVGLVVVAAAFFFGVLLVPTGRDSQSGAVLFVTYWSVVLVLTLVLLVLAVVDMALLKRRRTRRERDALAAGFRGRGPTGRTGNRGGDGT